MKSLYKKMKVLILSLFKYKFKFYGKGFYFGANLFIRPNTVEVGDYVYIGRNSHLSVSRLVIEDFVMLASNVSIIGGDHDYSIVGIPTRFTGRSEEKEVILKKDAWIGHGATIMHGVTVGEGAIVASGSIVTKNVEPFTIVAGVPAKYLKNRFEENDQKIHLEHIYKYKKRKL